MRGVPEPGPNIQQWAEDLTDRLKQNSPLPQVDTTTAPATSAGVLVLDPGETAAAGVYVSNLTGGWTLVVAL